MVSSFSTVRGARSVQERAAALAGTLVAGQFRAMEGLQPEDLNTDGTARVPSSTTAGWDVRARGSGSNMVHTTELAPQALTQQCPWGTPRVLYGGLCRD